MPQAKPALESKRLYLIVSTLKARLCLTIFDRWGSNEHLTLSPPTGPCLQTMFRTIYWVLNECMLSPCPWSQTPQCVFTLLHTVSFIGIPSALTTGPTPSRWGVRSSGTLSHTVPHLLNPSIGASQYTYHGLPGFWGYRNATDHLNEFYLFISDLKTELVPVKSSTSL